MRYPDRDRRESKVASAWALLVGLGGFAVNSVAWILVMFVVLGALGTCAG